MTFWKTILLRYAGGNHRRSLHGGQLSTRRGTERVENDNRHRSCCGLETPAYDGSANFDFHHVSFKLYTNGAGQSYADSSCGSNSFDCAGARDSRYNCQALRGIHAYIGERQNDRFNRQDGRETRRCYNCG